MAYEVDEKHRKHLDEYSAVSKLFTRWRKAHREEFAELHNRLSKFDPAQAHWLPKHYHKKPTFGFTLAILYEWSALPDEFQPGLMVADRVRSTVENDFNWMHGVLRKLYSQEEKNLRWRKIQAKKNGITWIEPNEPHPNPPPQDLPKPSGIIKPEHIKQDPLVELKLKVPASKVAAVMEVVNS